MAALYRIDFFIDGDGSLEVTYRDTKRPNRRIIEEYAALGTVSVNEAARITNVPRRTMYNWVRSGQVRTMVKDGNYRVPMREVRAILAEQLAQDDVHDDEDFINE